MPFKSKAQRRKFSELFRKGQITEEAFNQMAKDTPEDLPERVAGSGRPLKTGIRRPKYTKRYK